METIVINDVGPRDGLQNHPTQLGPAQRAAMIQQLVDAGIPAVEVASFVSPKAVPKMAGAAEVVAQLDLDQADFSALVPNAKGYALAKAAGVRIGLGSDWSPSGSKNLLGELKVAWLYSKHLLDGQFSGRDLMAMADRHRRLGVRTNADTPHDAAVARELGAATCMDEEERRSCGQDRREPHRRLEGRDRGSSVLDQPGVHRCEPVPRAGERRE